MIAEKWQNLTIFEQLGNIASEISRAIVWETTMDDKTKKNSLARALELINLTLANKNLKNGLKEITRLQELVADNYAGEKTYDVSLEDLYNCLLPFAVISK